MVAQVARIVAPFAGGAARSLRGRSPGCSLRQRHAADDGSAEHFSHGSESVLPTLAPTDAGEGGAILADRGITRGSPWGCDERRMGECRRGGCRGRGDRVHRRRNRRPLRARRAHGHPSSRASGGAVSPSVPPADSHRPRRVFLAVFAALLLPALDVLGVGPAGRRHLGNSRRVVLRLGPAHRRHRDPRLRPDPDHRRHGSPPRGRARPAGNARHGRAAEARSHAQPPCPERADRHHRRHRRADDAPRAARRHHADPDQRRDSRPGGRVRCADAGQGPHRRLLPDVREPGPRRRCGHHQRHRRPGRGDQPADDRPARHQRCRARVPERLDRTPVEPDQGLFLLRDRHRRPRTTKTPTK